MHGRIGAQEQFPIFDRRLRTATLCVVLACAQTRKEKGVSRLSLHLLGPPRAECDGSPLVTDTRKAIALLAYLSVTGETWTRDALATLLWPELDQTRARAALRRTLSSIHAACDAAWLLAERESVRLADDGSVMSDVAAFRHAVAERRSHGHPEASVCERCVDSLEKAAALYRDDFMAGFSLRDSVNFDDWQFFQAESLRREFADALEKLVLACSERAQWPPAIAHARRWLALDPLHEPAHRRLMLLYAWAGERTAALRQYQICADVLRRELEVPPLPETTALWHAIREQREPEPPVAATGDLAPALPPADALGAPQPAPPDEPVPERLPLVGRTHERARLREIHRAARGVGRLVVLEGEAGIGKSRLAEAFARDAQRSGALTVVARCYEGEQELVYAPFVQALRAALALPHSGERLRRIEPHWLRDLRRLLPEIDGATPESPADPLAFDAGARTRLFESVAHVLHRLLEGPQAGVLLIDDIQWADQASSELFSYIVHRLDEYPLCLIATLRNDEPERDVRIRMLMTEAQRRHNVQRIELGRLDADAVNELVRAMRPELANDAEFGERLNREAEGLPFFVVEYLAASAAYSDDAATRWKRPESIRDLLRARLLRAGEAQQQLLAAAAVIGRSFEFDALRAVSGRTEEETVAGVETLLAHRLIREVDGGAFDFCHEQLRAVAYEEISLARRRLLHRRVAEALLTQARLTGREPLAHAASLALHYEQAGLPQEAARHYFIAGQRASEIFANRDAIAHLTKAGALGYAYAGALHLLLGDVRTLLGEYAEAADEYTKALQTTEPEILLTVHHHTGRVLHLLGDFDGAAAAFERATSLLLAPDEDPYYAQLLADSSLTAWRRGQSQHALALAQRALVSAEYLDDRQALTRACTLLSHLARLSGDPANALAYAHRSLAVAEEVRDLALLIAALNAVALACVSAGTPEQALPPLNRALELCARQGDRHREAALHNTLADVYHLCGEPERAMDHLKQAVAIFAAIGSGLGGENAEIWKLTEW